MNVQGEFEPQILAFACHYCAYAAADLAGSMRLDYPANVKIVKLPCTGKIDALYLLKAFERGADGVLVPMLQDKGVLHLRCLAKYALAFFRIAFSSSAAASFRLGRAISAAWAFSGSLDWALCLALLRQA